MAAMVTAESLGKRYELGQNTAGYGRLTESLSNALRRKRGEEVSVRHELWALKDASFEVQRGEVVGLIGRNGAGKSTLLKILARVTTPTEGRAEIHGRVGSLLEVGTGFHQELTGRENVFLSGAILGMRRVEIQRKFDDIVAFSEVEEFIDTPVKRYSSGMGLRLGFAIAAFLEPEVLLVDEVLAVGDMKFREKCVGRIGEVSREDGRTVFFVSHDLNAILSTCSRAILVDHGTIVLDGAPMDVVAKYDAIQSQAARVDGEFARSEPNPRFPTPVFSAARIEAQGSSGGHVFHGESFRLVIETSGALEGRRFGIDLRILDSRNRPVTYISSAAMQDATFVAGDVVVLDIPFLPLVPGSYSVELLAGVTGTTLDHWANQIAFDVIRFDPFGIGSTFAPNHETGSVVPAHEWSSHPVGTSVHEER